MDIFTRGRLESDKSELWDKIHKLEDSPKLKLARANVTILEAKLEEAREELFPLEEELEQAWREMNEIDKQLRGNCN